MATDGTIEGTPTESGTFGYVVTVKDSAGNPSMVSCTITVNPPLAANCVTITAMGGVAITPVTMMGSDGIGGPYNFSATGLPTGLSMANDGTITGTPTESGTFTYVVTVKDSAGNSKMFTCSLTVSCPTILVGIGVAPIPFSAPPITLLNGVVGEQHDIPFIARGGKSPYTFTITAGNPPPGLSLQYIPQWAYIGTDFQEFFKGTLTQVGTFTFTVKATDANGCWGTQDATIMVAPQ